MYSCCENLKEENSKNTSTDFDMEYYVNQKVDLLKDECSIKGEKHPYYCVYHHLKLNLFSLGICGYDGFLNLEDKKNQHWREGNVIVVDGWEFLRLIACLIPKIFKEDASYN